MKTFKRRGLANLRTSGKMTEQDIIVGLNSIAAKYGYGKNGNEAFSNDEWNTIERAKEIIREYERKTNALQNIVK